ncbi:MAG: hypothetical protein HY885_13955 [Deltaproteobacteria bacterium]|nr:hypothetical protein [Deltaproteobacteria bacterium]
MDNKKHLAPKLFGLSAATLLIMAMPSETLALTASGTNISNSATVDYEVGGVNQADVTSNTVTVMVDAKVDLTVTGTGGNVNVSPGSTAQVLKFTVANTGNEAYDYALTAVAGTLDFTPTNVAIYVDDGNGIRDGGDTLTSTITNLAAASAKVVFIQADIPGSAANTQTASYNLKAVAALANAGGAIPAETTDTPATKQYVYADGAGSAPGDGDGDKTHSVSLDYVAVSSALTVTKSSTLISDPVNGVTDPLHIPGAIVEYTIVIGNGAAGAQADAVVLTDVLDANLAIAPDGGNYAAGKSVQITNVDLYGGAATALTNANDGDQATVSGQTVTVNGIVLSASETATIKIRAQIQ